MKSSSILMKIATSQAASMASLLNTKFIILNTKFIIFNTKFIILNTTFINFNTKFIILNTTFINFNTKFIILNIINTRRSCSPPPVSRTFLVIKLVILSAFCQHLFAVWNVKSSVFMPKSDKEGYKTTKNDSKKRQKRYYKRTRRRESLFQCSTGRSPSKSNIFNTKPNILPTFSIKTHIFPTVSIQNPTCVVTNPNISMKKQHFYRVEVVTGRLQNQSF